MAPQKLRTKVTALTTSAGLVVLLAGPTSTFGLGVPGADTTTGAVTTTVQGAVQTTEQTAATTVTQVQSTVQTTTQTAAVPQPSAPAPVPVQTTVKKVAAAPKQAVSRAVAPAKKRAVAVAAPHTGSQRLSSTRELSGTAAPATQRVAVAKRTNTHKASKPRTAAAPTSATTAPDPIQCDLPVLALLPGGSELGALVTLACNTANGLDLPARIGLAPESQGGGPSLGDVLRAIPSAHAITARARSAQLGAHFAKRTGNGPAAAGAAQGAVPGARLNLPFVGGTARGGAVVYADRFKAAGAQATVAPAAQDAASRTRHHHGWFSGQSKGTELLMAILFANLSILGGIVLWRLAIRWVIPRFV
jgi:hypothetical protein